MDCKFLDSYQADLDGSALSVWYCRRGEPILLGQTREAAGRACAACRLSDFQRSPGDLIAEVERRNQELVALTAIVSAVNGSPDIATALSVGLQTCMEVLDAGAGWIALSRDGSLDIAVHRGISEDYRERIERIPARDGIAGLVAREGAPVLVEDVYADVTTLPFARQEGLQSMMAAPLLARDELHGVLVVAAREPRAFTADDIYFAGAVGAQLAAAVEQALLLQGRLERSEREHRLLEAIEAVNKNLGRHAISLPILVEAAHIMGSAKSALLAIRGDMLVAADVYNLSDEFRRLFVIPLDDSLSGRAIQQGDTVAVEDVDAEALVDPYLCAAGGYRSFLTAPLRSFRGTYGALSVFFDEPRTFSDDDKVLLRSLAVHAAVALANERLMHDKDILSRTDALTGVHNRGYLELTLEQGLHDLHRNGGSVAMLFVDVDDLKGINDRCGHQTGDTVLRDIAAVLGESCRETDVVARYGGDEFVVFMPDTDEEGAALVLAKVQEQIAVRNSEPRDVPLAASIGAHAAGWPEAEDLLAEADRRMYEAKHSRAG